MYDTPTELNFYLYRLQYKILRKEQQEWLCNPGSLRP